MNTNIEAIELTDAELAGVAGGTNSWGGGGHWNIGGQDINVNTNVAVPINLNIAPTTNVALFSHDLSQTGSANNLQNFIGQHIS
jgi:hypothetical protein